MHPVLKYSEESGVSLYRIAQKSKLDRHTIRRIIAGETDPKLSTLQRIRKACRNQISLDDFPKIGG